MMLWIGQVITLGILIGGAFILGVTVGESLNGGCKE